MESQPASYQIELRGDMCGHSHSLEDSDMRKPMPAARAIVEQHTILGYAPSAVMNAVRDSKDSFLL
jgi:hypothetical protein